MAVTASGVLAIPVDALATAISNSATFMSMTSTATPTLALDKIYPVARSSTGALAYARPFCLIAPPENIVIHRGGYATGRLWMMFERDTDAGYLAIPRDAWMAFANLVGNIIAEVTLYCEGTSGTLAIQPGGIVAEAGIQRSASDEAPIQDYFQGSYWVNYGPTFNDS